MKDNGGNNPESNPEYAFLRKVHAGHECIELDARVLENSGEIPTQKGVCHEHANDQGQYPAESPAGDIQNQNDQQYAEEQVKAVGIAHAEGLLFNSEPFDPAPSEPQVKRCSDSQNHEHQIVDRNVSDPPFRCHKGVVVLGLHEREQRIRQHEKTCQMDPHVPVVHRHAESCGQEVIDCKQYPEGAQTGCNIWTYGASCRSFVEFPFDLFQFFLRKLIVRFIPSVVAQGTSPPPSSDLTRE